MKYKKKFLNYENSLTNKLLYIEFTENEKIPEINIDKNNIHTLYLYDNENIMFNEENYNDAIKLLQFQNYLKIYALYHLNKIKMKITINLYIGTIYDLLIQIKNSKKIENKLLEENIFNYIEDNLSDLNLSKFNLFQKENIIDVFNNFNFFDLSLFVTGYKSDFNISKIIVTNLNLIKKSKNIFLQESTLFNFQESSLENLINSFLILHYILETFRKNINLQKNCSNLFLIKFKFFKCTINVIKKKEEIKIYFDYSLIKEKTLFHFFKSSENLRFIITKYIKIITLLHRIKVNNCVLRISQTNFVSRQLTYYFKLIIKSIIDFIELNKYPNIEIYEKNLPNYNPNLLVYIRDKSESKNNNIVELRQILWNPLYTQKVKLFLYFLDQLELNFDLIVLSDNIKEFQLLRI